MAIETFEKINEVSWLTDVHNNVVILMADSAIKIEQYEIFIELYLNNFPQIAALESGLEVKLFGVGATFPYPVLIPVAQMIISRCLLVAVIRG